MPHAQPLKPHTLPSTCAGRRARHCSRSASVIPMNTVMHVVEIQARHRTLTMHVLHQSYYDEHQVRHLTAFPCPVSSNIAAFAVDSSVIPTWFHHGPYKRWFRKRLSPPGRPYHPLTSSVSNSTRSFAHIINNVLFHRPRLTQRHLSFCTRSVNASQSCSAPKRKRDHDIHRGSTSTRRLFFISQYTDHCLLRAHGSMSASAHAVLTT